MGRHMTNQSGPTAPTPAHVPDATTVSELLAVYEAQGYVMDFSVVEGGGVRCGACRTVSDAEGVAVTAFARAEGSSDPDDMAAVAVLTCPWCSMAGTLVLSYGPLASADDADVLERLNDDRPVGESAVLQAVDPPA